METRCDEHLIKIVVIDAVYEPRRHPGFELTLLVYDELDVAIVRVIPARITYVGVAIYAMFV